MLPEVTLHRVSREDVHRIAGWLQDDRVASRWFGHYACGDPVHRGYEPGLMVGSTDSEWDRVFLHDPHRSVHSIYNEWSEHIGECQVLVDDHGGAELSLLIGRTDLWHRGYGTATVMALLDQVFNVYKLDRAWVNVPEDNKPAIGLFKNLGFVHTETHALCQRRDGRSLDSLILGLEASKDRTRRREGAFTSAPPIVISVVGLPGSGSESLGAEIARITGARFLSDEIPALVAARLGRSVGELDALKASSHSFWSRALRNVATHWEQYGSMEDPYLMFDPRLNVGVHESHGYLTREEYLDGFKGVLAELALEGGVVLSGIGTNLCIPAKAPAFRLLVTSSDASRQRRIAQEMTLTAAQSEALRSELDRKNLTIARNVYGYDLLDVEGYDLILNIDSLKLSKAAEAIAAMLGVRGASDREGTPFPVH